MAKPGESMSIKKISRDSIMLSEVTEGIWSGCNIAEVLPTTGDTRMSCGIHELFASETIVEISPVDDVLYILEGEIEIDSDGITEKFQAGDFAYLHAGARQKFIVRERVKYIYVTYPRDWSNG